MLAVVVVPVMAVRLLVAAGPVEAETQMSAQPEAMDLLTAAAAAVVEHS